MILEFFVLLAFIIKLSGSAVVFSHLLLIQVSECKEKGKLRGNPGFLIILSPRGTAPTTSHCPRLPLPSPCQHFIPFIPVCAHPVFSSIHQVMNTWDVSTPWLLGGTLSCVHTHSFSGACAQVWDWGPTAAAWMTGHTHQQCQRAGPSPCPCHTCAVPADCCGGWPVSGVHLLGGQ